MNRSALAALLGGLLIAGCATRSSAGPTVLAVPGQGKTPAQFQREEANCREQAAGQVGTSSGLGSTLGAAAGALLGPGAGMPAYQSRYDAAYAQCMANAGNPVQTAAGYGAPAMSQGAPEFNAPPYGASSTARATTSYGAGYAPPYTGFRGPGLFRPGLSFGFGSGGFFAY